MILNNHDFESGKKNEKKNSYKISMCPNQISVINAL